jgi:hypothetical protein
MLLTHAVPRGQTVNSEYYSKVINIIITFEINEVASMDELKEKIQETDICINNMWRRVTVFPLT